jgi:hypothetical protein|tara:strand:+ start:1813 stop:1989 length:177 start_codon:yes stop_codon:yes gene_type:complete
MNITFVKYVKDPITEKNISVMATIDGNENLCVPLDTDNRHYQAILEWVDDGNTIEEAD